MQLITMQKSNYLNKEIPYLTNVNIYEYDMSSGGFNILRSKKVFSKDVEDSLLKMNKEERNITIGKILRKKPKLSEILINGFKEYMTEFCKVNGIKNEEILSIKKDAIFIINKRCKNLKLNEYVELKEKNKYTSYLYLSEIEFYNNRFDCHVKGINDNILDRNLFFNEIKNIMKLMEKNNDEVLFRYLRKLQKNYLEYEVDKEMYREFNSNNQFRVEVIGKSFYFDNIEEEMLDYISIEYNYYTYLVPIIKALI